MINIVDYDKVSELTLFGVFGTVGYDYIRWILDSTDLSDLARNKTVSLTDNYIRVVVRGSRKELTDWLLLVASISSRNIKLNPIFYECSNYIYRVIKK